MASFSFGCLGQPAHGLVSTGLLTTLALEYAKAEFAVAQPWGCSERMLEEPQGKNGFVARVATRRGLFQGRHKGVYFRLNDRSKSWGDFTDFWESEIYAICRRELTDFTPEASRAK